MPKAAEFALVWSEERGGYELCHQGSGTCEPLADADWPAWLGAHAAFAFHGRQGQVSLLKEQRGNRGEGYWYAYRRQGRRTVKAYAGRSGGLTPERLEAVAKGLAGGHAPAPAAAAAEPLSQLPLLEPKLLLPRLHRPLVDRTELLTRLDGALACTLTVLSAPAGFGKTTLVRQWIEVRSADGSLPPVAWISLDAGDNDPVRFWRYVISACQAWPGLPGRQALDLLGAAVGAPFDTPDVAKVLATFLNSLTQTGRPGLIVLEDYHAITAAAIHDSLAFFLAHLPVTLHLIVLSRGALPLLLAGLRARGDLLELTAADLRFAPDETERFLTQATGAPPPPALLSQLDARLEGWAAGLRLFSLLLRGRLDEGALTALAGSQRPLLDYFVTEVLGAQPEPLQRFLLQTSLLTRLTGSLCDAVTERHDSEVLLDALERAGLFLERLDGPGEWYRYHALFAEAMQTEARRRLGEGALQALSRRASQWYEQHELLDEAIEAALAGADLLRAADLIERRVIVPSFGRSQEMYTLRRWLGQVPPEVLRLHPALCPVYALVLVNMARPDQPAPAVLGEIEGLLQMAEEQWLAAGETDRLGELYALRAYIAQRQFRQAEAAANAARALGALPPGEQNWRAVALAVLCWDAVVDGRLANARQAFDEMRALWAAVGNLHAHRSTMIVLGSTCVAQAELHLAAQYLRPALAEARQFGDEEDIGMAQLALAQLHYEWNQLTDAEAAAQEASKLAAALKDQPLQVHAALIQVRLDWARGAAGLAQQRLAAQVAQLLPQREPVLYREVLSTQAELLLAAGDRPAAERCLNALATLPAPRAEREELAGARLLLADGRPDAALAVLERLLAAAEAAGRVRGALEIRLVMARAEAARRQVQKAREHLHRVLALTHTEGHVRLYLEEGAAMAGLLRSLLPGLREPSLRAHVRALLGAFAPAERGAPAPAEPLSQQEQRVLCLLAAGLSNPEIAAELVVSVNTVKAHVKSIYRKLNVRNRQEAVAAFRR